MKPTLTMIVYLQLFLSIILMTTNDMNLFVNGADTVTTEATTTTAAAAAVTRISNTDTKIASRRRSRRRTLRYETINTLYHPLSIVTDELALDMDLSIIKNELSRNDDDGWDSAYKIYKNGAYSKSTAIVTLNEPLQLLPPKTNNNNNNNDNEDEVLVVIENDTPVVGFSTTGNHLIKGYIVNGPIKNGDQILHVAYAISPIQEDYVNCQVGANPNPKFDGCFASDGNLRIGNVDGGDITTTTTSTSSYSTRENEQQQQEEEEGDEIEVYYSYNITSDNVNLRTIESLSTTAQELFYDCTSKISATTTTATSSRNINSNTNADQSSTTTATTTTTTTTTTNTPTTRNKYKYCPYPEYEKFVEYYGKYAYADHLIVTAFENGATRFRNGNVDFADSRIVGLTEFISKTMSYMSFYMYVIHEMEEALYKCRNKVNDNNKNNDDYDYDDDGNNSSSNANEDDAIHSWDKAVAYYSGSRSSISPRYSGDLLYGLADERCKEFRTCGDGRSILESNGTANVNFEINRLFTEGQQNIQNGQCQSARQDDRDIISQLMVVPLIQGTLRFAHIVDNDGSRDMEGDKHRSLGALFAMTTLPFLHDCNSIDAETIYDNMKIGHNPDFGQVKAAFGTYIQVINERQTAREKSRGRFAMR